MTRIVSRRFPWPVHDLDGLRRAVLEVLDLRIDVGKAGWWLTWDSGRLVRWAEAVEMVGLSELKEDQ
jgi:hypothetical protein